MRLYRKIRDGCRPCSPRPGNACVLLTFTLAIVRKLLAASAPSLAPHPSHQAEIAAVAEPDAAEFARRLFFFQVARGFASRDGKRPQAIGAGQHVVVLRVQGY